MPVARPPFTMRAATADDAAAVTALIAAHELATQGVVDIDEEDVRSDWQRPSFDLATSSLLALAGDRAVGYAELFEGRAWVHVHPDAQRQGLGTALLLWTEERARAERSPRIGQTISDLDVAGRQLLTAHGYRPRWEAWIFTIDLGDEPAPVALPDGVTLRPLHRPDDDRALYELIDTAFGEWHDRDPGMTFEDWRASYLDRGDADPGLVLILEHGGALIGAAVCLEYGEEGWIQQLAVARSYRSRGLGGALLRAAFGVFRRRGLRKAGLSTESRTGARALYEHIGMRVDRSFTRWSKDL